MYICIEIIFFILLIYDVSHGRQNMKRKRLLFLSSFLMIGSLVGVAGCSNNNGFVLRAINPEIKWSDRDIGFFF